MIWSKDLKDPIYILKSLPIPPMAVATTPLLNSLPGHSPTRPKASMPRILGNWHSASDLCLALECVIMEALFRPTE